MDGWGVVSCHAVQSCTRLSLFVNEEAENVFSCNPAVYLSVCPSSTHTDY